MGRIFEKMMLAFRRIFSSVFNLFRKKEIAVSIQPVIPTEPNEVIKEVPDEVVKEEIKEVPVEVVDEVPVLVEPRPEQKPTEEKEPEISDPFPPPTEVKYDNSDIARLTAQWGTSDQRYDFNRDGKVDGADLGILLNRISESTTNDKIDVFSPHHEVMHDKWLGPADKDIFFKGSLESKLVDVGARKYYIFYPSLNFAEDYASKKINVDIIANDVRQSVGEDFEGYGLLDYEGGFFDDLDKGGDTKANQVITQVMIDALTKLRKLFPKMKWSYYGLPKNPFWLLDPNTGKTWATWATAVQEVKDKVFEHHVNAYKELLRHCDYMNPSLYNYYDPTDPSVQKHIPKFEESEYEYRRTAALIARRINELNGTKIPVIPMFCNTYAISDGTAEHPGKLVQKDFMDRCVFKPNIDAGVDGFMYWNAIHYYAWEALPTNDRPPVLSNGISFCKNFGYEAEQSKIPWAKGSGPEEVRSHWRNKYVESYNLAALKYIDLARGSKKRHS